MNVKNCKLCGRIFNYIGGPPTCPKCREKMEEKFQEVKGYIREHPGVGITDVAEACEVDPGQIRQWLREERLELTESSASVLVCETCGAPIRSGRFCEKCKNRTANDLQELIDANKPKPQPKKGNDKESPRMRFL
ncbi:MAG: flagellar protein [Clostridium sp.]|jgi:flagellar operon protein (TIGR03826 family)|nr:flagellar protein [Clostridium sp.]